MVQGPCAHLGLHDFMLNADLDRLEFLSFDFRQSYNTKQVLQVTYLLSNHILSVTPPDGHTGSAIRWEFGMTCAVLMDNR
jgi:hypothetical protein